MDNQIQTSESLRDVKYEIRGQLANHAYELEKRGYEIISLNIGNPGLFGFRAPETMRLAMIENLGQAEPYCHQKGIFPAREAVVMQQQDRGVLGLSVEEVFVKPRYPEAVAWLPANSYFVRLRRDAKLV